MAKVNPPKTPKKKVPEHTAELHTLVTNGLDSTKKPAINELEKKTNLQLQVPTKLKRRFKSQASDLGLSMSEYFLEMHNEYLASRGLLEEES